jgi:hypothetical protein
MTKFNYKIQGYAALIAAGFIIGLMALAVYGWVMNIVQLLSTTSIALTDITLLTVLRVVGIFFAPLGSVLGLL